MTHYIWSYEHEAWWRPSGMGYTRNLNEAGLYTAQEAGKYSIHMTAIHEIAVPKKVAREAGPPRYHPYDHKDDI